MSENDFGRTQEFRETMLAFAASTKTELQGLNQRFDRMEIRLSSGDACVAGARHLEAIENQRRRVNDLHRDIEILKRPTRRAALWTGSAVGGAGLLGVLLNWLVENWSKLFP